MAPGSTHHPSQPLWQEGGDSQEGRHQEGGDQEGREEVLRHAASPASRRAGPHAPVNDALATFPVALEANVKDVVMASATGWPRLCAKPPTGSLLVSTSTWSPRADQDGPAVFDNLQ